MRPLPQLARILGYVGVLPFFFLTIALLIKLPVAGMRLDWLLVAYAAVIVSFLGAVHWGIVLAMQEKLNERDTQLLLGYSVSPAVVAWLLMLCPVKVALVGMAVRVVLAYAADVFLLFRRVGLESEYAKLRLHLTVIVTLLLFAAALGGVK